MVFLAPQLAGLQLKEEEDSHLPGELITLGLKMNHNRPPLSLQH